MPRIVEFGTFQVLLDSGELLREGVRLKLGGQPFQVLEHLLARAGEVVTREELRTAVWQEDTFVDFDHGLNTAINKIREALGDSASNPRFVETVPRRGYRFIAPVLTSRPVPSAPVPQPPPVLSPPSVPPPANASPWLKWSPAAAVCFAALAGGLIFFRNTAVAPLQYKLTQITRDSGLTYQPSISADGNFVVYSSDRATGKDMDIWIQHVSGGQAVRLTSSSGNERFPSISDDGRKVAFEGSGTESGIFVVPALGGTPKLVSALGTHPRISPNGASIAYSTGHYMMPSEIHVVSTEGGSPRNVTAGLNWALAPIWTRDGRHLLSWSAMELWKYDYYQVSTEGGAATKTGVAERLRDAGVESMLQLPYSREPSPVASAGSRGLVIAARAGDGHDLWLTPLVAGKASPAIRITVGALAMNPSIATTGRIAFAKLSVNHGLWMLPLEGSSGRATGEMQRVWRENVSVEFPNVSANGKKMVYVSDRMGDRDVWMRDLETGEDRQLTSTKEDEFRAVISPDGGLIARTEQSPQRHILTMPSGGGMETPVCRNCGTGNVQGWSPDGTKILYNWGNPIRHATVDIKTGQKQDVVWHPTADIHSGRISPDGRWIAFTVVSSQGRVIYVASLPDGGGGKPESWIRVSGVAPVETSFWSPDGNLLYMHYADTLWARKLDFSTKKPIGESFLVQRFHPARSPQFSANPITKNAVYFMMKEATSNIWLAEPVSQ